MVEEDSAGLKICVPTDEIWKWWRRAHAATGMISYRAHSPNALSGGQKQRLQLQVMAMQPECIVLGEPTAMLDPNDEKRFFAVRKLNEEKGVTVILITPWKRRLFADRVFDCGQRCKLVMQGRHEIFPKWRN